MPGWKSNVTIKRCRTVVLDVDVSLEIFTPCPFYALSLSERPAFESLRAQLREDLMSLIVYGTLIIENRPGDNCGWP